MSSAKTEKVRTPKLHVKKGDMVLVIAGKEKGKRGKVLKTSPKDLTVYVEKLNMQKRHQKGRGKNLVSSIIEKEGPIHVSNVKKLED